MLPKVNQILYIQLDSFDEEEANQVYKSRIADVQDDCIAMEVPLHEKTGNLKKLHRGDELSVYYLTDGGVKNYFNTTVTGFREDVIRLVLINKPNEESISKVQRRNFLRVPAEAEIAVLLANQIRFVSLTEDIGGGGVSFICEESRPLKVEDKLNCWLLLAYKNNTIAHANFIAEVVRIKPADQGKVTVMTRFQRIADTERQKIIRYCFERQFDMRK